MNYETLLYERTHHVVTLTYNRPSQRNAVKRTMCSPSCADGGMICREQSDQQ
jgi:enoyl-CoA hydratase/carnithine racemase